ncbi:multicopper oxidase family protein [Acidisoma cellulosilytica]|uniref:Multicopper oxidase family protein n=1 Tax=Acidisoma cellulosilyticum TaxID=2802395 RepID=A0A963Z079_9PROT|nr:multicopper oxidase family protein [Acidisoma cellulosilyticum]MCB8880311.1 multicopper oxidase family protein [Acidisoma cellulosilyticum]
MTDHLTRRRLLGAAGATLALPLARRAEASAPVAHQLVAGTRMLDVNGRAARVYRLVNETGQPGLALNPGERFNVTLHNTLAEQTIIHWHGQLPDWKQDGFPWPETPPLPAGASKTYDFAPIAGTFWMHSHQGMQEQGLMTAPLIVRDNATATEDRQEVVLMLHDFSFRSPEDLLAGLSKPGAMGGMSAGATGSMQMTAGQMTAGQMKSGSMPTMPMNGMPSDDVDLNDIDYDAFLANDRTLTDPEVVSVEKSGRLRLRVINAASSSQFWLDLGALTGQVVAVDGHAVHPVSGARFPLAIAQRLDILVDLPTAGAFPVLARLEGSDRQTGLVLATAGAAVKKQPDKAGASTSPLDLSLEQKLSAVTPLAARKADISQTILLSGAMQPYAWSLDQAAWPNVPPLMLTAGQRVEIDLINASTMAHPMHLHGHAFQVVALGGKPVQGAVRDTVMVPPLGGSVRIAFDAVNPGRWAFHCHNLYHMMTGMMMEFRYQGIAV